MHESRGQENRCGLICLILSEWAENKNIQKENEITVYNERAMRKDDGRPLPFPGLLPSGAAHGTYIM